MNETEKAIRNGDTKRYLECAREQTAMTRGTKIVPTEESDLVDQLFLMVDSLYRGDATPEQWDRLYVYGLVCQGRGEAADENVLAGLAESGLVRRV
jgi:hypothetical protein